MKKKSVDYKTSYKKINREVLSKVIFISLVISFSLFFIACESYQLPLQGPSGNKTDGTYKIPKNDLEQPFIGDDVIDRESQNKTKSQDDAIEQLEKDSHTYLNDSDEEEQEEIDAIGQDLQENEESITQENKTEQKKERTEEKKDKTILQTITVNETEKVIVHVAAKDADGDKLTIKFESPLDKNGEWQTKEGDAGNYQTEVTVSDGKTQTKGIIEIIVLAKNKPPIIKANDITVEEGQEVVLPLTISDPDNDTVFVEIKGWMNQTSKQTKYTDAGIHRVFIEASDGKQTANKTIIVRVMDVNRPPTIENIFSSKK